MLCRSCCFIVIFSVVTSGLTESREDSELEKPLVAKSLLKSFSGLNVDNTPLAFICLLVLSCCIPPRSLSASAMRFLMLARSPFKAVKSWCTVSQFSSPVEVSLWLPLLASGKLISSPYSGCWMLPGWSSGRRPPFTAVRTCSKNKTCKHKILL